MRVWCVLIWGKKSGPEMAKTPPVHFSMALYKNVRGKIGRKWAKIEIRSGQEMAKFSLYIFLWRHTKCMELAARTFSKGQYKNVWTENRQKMGEK